MKTMDLEVVDIRKIVGDGNLKAFADVRVGESLVIKGFCVMQGKSGIFVSMPRKASKDGRWFDIIEPDDTLKRQLENKVLESYDRETDGVRG
jgi:DNA-binding cell septation regulator SpoVG